MRRGTWIERLHREKGAYAILFAILVVAMFAMVAIVVDLSAARAAVRNNRTVADFAAEAAATKLPGSPQAACLAAWDYVRENVAGLPTTGPCGANGVNFPTTCTAATPATNYVFTIGQTTITFRYPIPAGDIALQGRVETVDGTDPCERFAVTVRSNVTTLFGGITGGGLSAPATAVSRGYQGTTQTVAVALLMLDPYYCKSLQTGSSNTFIHVLGTQSTAGIIAVDSNGTGSGPGTGTDCNNAQRYTIDTNTTSGVDKIRAYDSLDGTQKGLIRLFAYLPGQTLCNSPGGNIHACNQDDFNSLRIEPQATRATQRATRAPVDHTFNCKASYPAYYGITIGTCDPKKITADADGDGIPDSAYIDELTFKIGNGSTVPAGFNQLTTSGLIVGKGSGQSRCDAIAGSTYTFPAGNWYVDCPSSGPHRFNVSGNVTFPAGNIVFQNGPQVSGGTLNVNTSTNTAINPANLTASCLAVVCTTAYAQTANFVYIANGDLSDSSAGATFNFQKTMTFIRTGRLNIASNGGLATFIAPTEGPFRNLAMWNDPGALQSSTSAQPRLGGGGVVVSEGVFFFPQGAPFNYGGQGNQAIPTNAQFIDWDLNADGQGVLEMRPDPNRVVPIPIQGEVLIR